MKKLVVPAWGNVGVCACGCVGVGSGVVLGRVLLMELDFPLSIPHKSIYVVLVVLGVLVEKYRERKNGVFVLRV